MKHRVFYLDVLKGLSIPLVALLHVAAYGLSERSIDTTGWLVCNLYDSFVRFVVPVFVMVSGAIYLNSDKPVNIWKAIKHVLIPLIFWSLVYSFLINISHSHVINNVWIGQFLDMAFLRPNYNWFLFMLIGLYLCIPLLRCITSDRKHEEYFLLLWCVFGVFIPSVMIFPSINSRLSPIVNTISVYLPMGYAGLFVLGHYLNTYGTTKFKLLPLSYFAMGGVIYIVTNLLSRKDGVLNTWSYDYLHPFVIIESISIFMMAKILLGNNPRNDSIGKAITMMAKFSMGIYLVHMPILVILHRFGLSHATFSPVFSIPVTTLIIYTFSFCVVFVISKIPVLKKYII